MRSTCNGIALKSYLGVQLAAGLAEALEDFARGERELAAAAAAAVAAAAVAAVDCDMPEVDVLLAGLARTSAPLLPAQSVTPSAQRSERLLARRWVLQWVLQSAQQLAQPLARLLAQLSVPPSGVWGLV